MGARHSRVLHRSLNVSPPKAVGGDGVWLIAEDGRRILDAARSEAVDALGAGGPHALHRHYGALTHIDAAGAV